MVSREVKGDRERLSEAQEDYLKQILLATGDKGSYASAGDLAVRLGVRPASVTGMVQRLAQVGLVDYEPYRGVCLTEAGRRIALEILRHHRLLETFLAERLGFEWSEVHEEAERLEHAISERLEDRIAEQLGHPTHDPHGEPIPAADLSMPECRSEIALSRAGAGASGALLRVATQDADELKLLSRLGLELGAGVEVLEQHAEGVRVKVSGEGLLLPRSLADKLWIEKERP